RRERASVATALNQTDARFMADTALQRFQSELITRMAVRRSSLDYDLMLTRNFVNPNGFDPAITALDATNVNYDVRVGGGGFIDADRIRNIGNLFFDPRAPVFVKNTDGSVDFRFYLDYNRNGRFETNGLQPIVIDEAGTTNGVANFNGDPEWIGVLQNPEAPHSPTNLFVGRYLYFAVPVGKTLDLNHFHNYAKGDIGLPTTMPGNGDGFSRNQGVGSWELNLGAFLYSLNTNMYPMFNDYVYNAASSSPNTGTAFNDAVSMLSYRYNGSFDNLPSAFNFFGNGSTNFQTDLIDNYSTAPIISAPFANTADPDAPAMVNNRPWSGGNNVKTYFELQDMLDPAKGSANFISKLQTVSSNKNSYDRYTFFRWLEQLGTGSEPEVLGKINLNYTNDLTSNVVPTNFVKWEPLQFFSNTVTRLFQDNFIVQPVSPGVTNYYLFNLSPENRVRAGISYTNIQIYPTNEYTAPVHRLLQLAANIYDATTTNKLPTVFWPEFGTIGASNFITGYVVTNNDKNFLNGRVWQDKTTSPLQPNALVYGIPAVIGAKKGLPNFNKFVMQNTVQVSRNLQLIKRDLSFPVVILAT
ncbi:MAG: hypothetical protein ABJC04_12855, partial [Verrucomicrobiota bacterium]